MPGLLRSLDLKPTILSVLPLLSENDQRILPVEVHIAALKITTAIGQSISPAHRPIASGTLGLYLGPATGTDDDDDDDDEKPVWALTCHHVVLPPNGSTIKIHLPSSFDLERSLDTIRSSIKRAEKYAKGDEQQTSLPLSSANVNITEPVDESTKLLTRSQLAVYKRLEEVMASFKATDEDGKSIGTVFLSPPISAYAPEGDAGNPFTLDWALVRLRREKFPKNFTFENVVDLKKEFNLVAKINE